MQATKLCLVTLLALVCAPLAAAEENKTDTTQNIDVDFNNDDDGADGAGGSGGDVQESTGFAGMSTTVLIILVVLAVLVVALVVAMANRP